MKLNKKKVFTLALALCLIATISLGSLAWFTDTDSVTNDFFIAGSEDQDPDDIFSVDVWENGPDGRDEDGIEYPNILPGDELKKEVNIENTGSYAQYIRATVTVSDASIWQEVLGEHFVALDKIVNGLNGDFTLWSIVCDERVDTLTYVLYYENTLAPDVIVNLFKEVAIPEALTREQAAKMDGGFVLNVVADAVQTMNVGANAVEAFATVGRDVPAGNYCFANSANLNSSIYVEKDTVYDNVTLEVKGNGGSGDYNYAIVNEVGAKVVFNKSNLTTERGGIAVAGGATAEFNSGSISMVANTTNPRYVFYVEGAGSEVVINDGNFDFTAKTLKRAYIYAGAGTTVYVNGGTFGTPSTRSGYTAGILGTGTVVIKGGTFGFDPSAWVATGYVAVESNGVWTVSAAQ